MYIVVVNNRLWNIVENLCCRGSYLVLVALYTGKIQIIVDLRFRIFSHLFIVTFSSCNVSFKYCYLKRISTRNIWNFQAFKSLSQKQVT